ncbi:MFS transporter [Spirillospora sp. CA-255316]
MSRHIWERDFRLLWTGSAVSQLGAVGASTATPLLALSLGGSPISAGWATAAGALPGLLFHLPAGWLADRADRRRIMQVSQLVRMAAGVLFVGGLMTVGGPPWLLLPAVVAAGTCAVFYGIAENAAVRDLVYSGGDTDSPDAEGGRARGRESALARHEARHHVAQVAGRPVGGFLFGVWPFLPYLMDAVTALFSFHLMRKMEPGKNGRRVGRGPTVVPVAASLGLQKAEPIARSSRELLAKDRFLCTVLVVCAVANFFFQSVVLLLIVSAQERGISSSLTGLFLSASGIGGLLGAFAAPRALRRAGPKKIVMWCVWSWLVLVLVVAVAGHPLVGLVAWGSCSFMGAHVNVALEVHKGVHVPPELQGKITGIARFLTGGAIPLGALSGGYIIAELAPHATAMLVTLVMAVMAVSVSVAAFPPKRGRLAEMVSGGWALMCSLCLKVRGCFPRRKAPVRPFGPQPVLSRTAADLCHETSLGSASHDSMSQ